GRQLRLEHSRRVSLLQSKGRAAPTRELSEGRRARRTAARSDSGIQKYQRPAQRPGGAWHQRHRRLRLSRQGAAATGRQIRLRRLVAQFRVAGRSAVRRDTAQLARRKKMDDGTARTGVTEKSRRLHRFIWSGRRRRTLRFDKWPKPDYRQHRKSLQTGTNLISQASLTAIWPARGARDICTRRRP